METWLPIVVSLVGCVGASISFLWGCIRDKKEATINAYGELQQDALDKYNAFYIDKNRRKDENRALLVEGKLTPGGDDWAEVTKYLAALDRFSVGVLRRVYSVKIVRQLSSGYLITVHKELSNVIRKKREDDLTQGDHYENFTKLVRKLEKYR